MILTKLCVSESRMDPESFHPLLSLSISHFINRQKMRKVEWKGGINDARIFQTQGILGLLLD